MQNNPGINADKAKLDTLRAAMKAELRIHDQRLQRVIDLQKDLIDAHADLMICTGRMRALASSSFDQPAEQTARSQLLSAFFAPPLPLHKSR